MSQGKMYASPRHLEGTYEDPEFTEPPAWFPDGPVEIHIPTSQGIPDHPAVASVKRREATLVKPYRTDHVDHSVLTEYRRRRSTKSRLMTPGVRQHPDALALFDMPKWYSVPELIAFKRMFALNSMDHEAAAHSTTAALLLGWPLPPRLTTDALRMHVTVPPSRSRIERIGYVEHRTRFHSPLRFDSVTVNTSLVVLASLSDKLTALELLAVVENLCGSWRSDPEFTVAGLRELYDAGPKIKGKPTVRRVLPLCRDGVGSPQETYYRRALVEAGIPEPDVAPELTVPGLPDNIHPDMVWWKLGTILEYDGVHHQSDRQQYLYDQFRYEKIREAGWKLFVVTKERFPEQVVAEIRAWFAHIASTGEVPTPRM